MRYVTMLFLVLLGSEAAPAPCAHVGSKRAQHGVHDGATSGDSIRVEAIKAEMERLNAEIELVMNEEDPTAAFEAATASESVDLEMSIAVTVKPGVETPLDGAQPIEVSGASSAWQWTSGDDGQHGNALVLLGAWRPAASRYGLESVATPGEAPEQAQAISVKIIAH